MKLKFKPETIWRLEWRGYLRMPLVSDGCVNTWHGTISYKPNKGIKTNSVRGQQVTLRDYLHRASRSALRFGNGSAPDSQASTLASILKLMLTLGVGWTGIHQCGPLQKSMSNADADARCGYGFEGSLHLWTLSCRCLQNRFIVFLFLLYYCHFHDIPPPKCAPNPSLPLVTQDGFLSLHELKRLCQLYLL